jgi:vacuolar-type H+-ATPase subunit E/Vma4
MSEPRSILDAQVNALEKLVETSRAERCRQLIEDAKRGATEILKRAHRENRARMRAAIEEQRKRMEDTLASTRARLATRARQQQQQVDKEHLASAWSRLSDVLLERWQDADCRRRWMMNLVEEALARLPGEPWRIEHPRDFDSAELSTVSERIAEHCGGEHADFVVVEDLRAGLRILAGGACVDGTLTGLFIDRNRIEAELLAFLRDHDEERPRT